jgi:hypothetical protein
MCRATVVAFLQVQSEWAAVQQAAQQRSKRGLADWQARGGQLLGNDLHEVRAMP